MKKKIHTITRGIINVIILDAEVRIEALEQC